MSFVSYILNGISLGSVYAIIALGYTMVYGIAKMLNFAHGDIIMVGSYVAFIAINSMGLPVPVSILLSVVVCTVLGMVIERVAYKPLRHASKLAVLITAIGASYFLQNVALLIFGANTKSFTSIVGNGSVQLAGGALSVTIALTFAIGSGLAAIAGVLLCSAYPSLTPYTGSMPGIKAFVAAVFGGIGSIPGAFIGGILLGVIEILGKAYISSQLADAIVFAVLIVVLVVKPTGLLGKQIQEKV